MDSRAANNVAPLVQPSHLLPANRSAVEPDRSGPAGAEPAGESARTAGMGEMHSVEGPAELAAALQAVA